MSRRARPPTRDRSRDAAQFAPGVPATRGRLGLSPINSPAPHASSRRHKRGFWSLCIFMVVSSSSRCSPSSSPTTAPILAYYKGELLVPILVNYPDEKFGGFTAYADYRLTDTADEIKAHGWMLWPPIRFSYRTVNYASATPAPSPPTWTLTKAQMSEAAGAAAAKADRRSATAAATPSRRTGSAPTRSTATCSPASSTAPAPRSCSVWR